MLPSALSLTWISSLIPNGTKRFFVRLSPAMLLIERKADEVLRNSQPFDGHLNTIWRGILGACRDGDFSGSPGDRIP